MKILMVFTSHDMLGKTGRKTGFWLEEGAAPYYVFKDAGVELTLASPKGGQPPVDPKSDPPETRRRSWRGSSKTRRRRRSLPNTAKLDDMRSDDFDAIFYPAGMVRCGTSSTTLSIALIEAFYNAGKPVAAVCHAPAFCTGSPTRARRSCREARDRLREQRRGRGRSHRCRPVPGRGRIETAGRALREGAEKLAALRHHRWTPDHRPESGSSTSGAEALVKLLNELKRSARTSSAA